LLKDVEALDRLVEGDGNPEVSDERQNAHQQVAILLH
jgi:hypothetical protein